MHGPNLLRAGNCYLKLNQARLLGRLMTVRGRVPQGGILSDLAVNLYFLQTDDLLWRKARKLGGDYTRLLDDLDASFLDRPAALSFAKVVDHAIQVLGLTVSPEKLERRGFLGGDQRKLIHGADISCRRGIALDKNNVANAIEACRTYAAATKNASPADIVLLAHQHRGAVGHLNYCRQADFSPARHLRQMIKAANHRVLDMLRSHGLSAYRNRWWDAARNEPQALLRRWRAATRNE